ncbi:MAG: hypothetical protein CO094_09130 [Anaerolineae bacterium CG_4_9_14_3_um_filter_57_17]|nr:hypothetical protein [bacterium]NCT20508.1 hypothetical protein [bacterium]OIO86374.1 MAG: hypothetical protein AUK01_03760 [Anaerolineae bacterium CG2_30_57_67]PJB65701.1 MAG: hypothetical protein CO094_09130 [Anaerolineae bacterium CG_4_9_14_3_um_filter_57_17]
MSPQRWFFFLLSILAGMGMGLLYGWELNPVQYVDTAPNTLREDFRADYALMVAEIYQTEQNPQNAARRLALLGSQPPAEIASAALQFSRANGYDERDIQRLQTLTLALQIFSPAGGLP